MTITQDQLMLLLNRQWRLTHATLDEMRRMKEKQEAQEDRLRRVESRLRWCHWTLAAFIWASCYVSWWLWSKIPN